MTIRTPTRVVALFAIMLMNGCGTSAPRGPGTTAPAVDVAESALRSGAGQVALQVSETILRDSPDNIGAWEIKGDALTLLGQYDDAAATYQALLTRDSNSIRANIGMGRIKLMTDPAAAEELFQQVLTRQPTNLTALNNLGIARDLLDRHSEAQAAYRQALATDPGLSSARVNLALSLAMNGQGTAGVQMLKSTASEPDAPLKVRHDYAIVLAMAGNRAEAEQILGESMAPEVARRMLNSVMERRARTTAGQAPDEHEPARMAEADLDVRLGGPPGTDHAVVARVGQVPAIGARPVGTRPVGIAAEGTKPAWSESATWAAPQAAARPAAAPAPIAVALAAPMPSVVRPGSADAPAGSAPVVESGDQVAAAEATPRSLALSALSPGRQGPPAAGTAVPIQPRDFRTSAFDRDSPPATRTNVAPSEEAIPAIQFAAAPSEGAARSFWQDLVRRYRDDLGEREATLERVELGRQVFWRLRTGGFATVAEARALCARIRASGPDCFVPRS